jgi:hypothetical protein
VYLFAVDPVERCSEICKEHGSMFFDVDYPPGPQLAGPFAGTHGLKAPYNFANLRCFLRFGNANPPPTCVFDTASGHSILETVVQVDTMCGNSEILCALGAISGLYNGQYITSLINPSKELSPYGLYSLKIRLMCENPQNEGKREMVDAWIMLDDFVPCDESGCMIFASSHKHHSPSAWACLFEKAMTKLFGQERGGYRETAHSPEYAGRLLELLTGVACKEYDVMKQKDWTKLHKLLTIGQDCRIGAATVTKRELRKSKAQGIVTGVGVHGYTVMKTIEIKSKFKKPHKLLRLRNTWGRFEWQGPWSDDSPQFKEHHRLLETPGGDDGSFWISVEDFSALFQGIYAVIIPKEWSNHTDHTFFLHSKAELRNSHMFLDCDTGTGEEEEAKELTEEEAAPAAKGQLLGDIVSAAKRAKAGHGHGRRTTFDTGPSAVFPSEYAYDADPGMSQERAEIQIMNSEKPRSTKGPSGQAMGELRIVGSKVGSIKMSSKLSSKISAKISGKYSVKASTKTSTKMSAKMSTKTDASDEADDFGADISEAVHYGAARGRRLPRHRRNSYVF